MTDQDLKNLTHENGLIQRLSAEEITIHTATVNTEGFAVVVARVAGVEGGRESYSNHFSPESTSGARSLWERFVRSNKTRKDLIYYFVDTRVTNFSFSKTYRNQKYEIQVSVYFEFRIADPKKATFEVKDPLRSLIQQLDQAIREVILEQEFLLLIKLETSINRLVRENLQASQSNMILHPENLWGIQLLAFDIVTELPDDYLTDHHEALAELDQIQKERLKLEREQLLTDEQARHDVRIGEIELWRDEVLLKSEVDFSAFFPASAEPDQNLVLMVFAHLPTVIDEIAKMVADYENLMAGSPIKSTSQGFLPVEANSLLTFIPQATGVRFSPTEQSVVWQPPYQSANFLFSVPKHLSTEISGRVLIIQGPLIIGEIFFKIKLASAEVASSKGLNSRSGFHSLHPVFASYSHKDSRVMEYFRQARENLGQKMLVDIYDLRAGEHWQNRLLEMIDECAIFQLFWSDNSAQSEYCRKEWRYALKYQDSRPCFIQPVWWKAPMPPPPTELAHLHFQKVNVPLET